ncbi:MAG: hypothetical protein ACXWR1_21500 [Bdellovibrionota bacterium]
MKKILLAALLVLTAGTGAQAQTITLALPGAPTDFVSVYTLDSFKAAEGSILLQGAGQIVSGDVAISQSRNELRLTLNRHMLCPRGMFCMAMMPAPTVITLPIVSRTRDACGGLILMAERDLERVDGGRTRVEVQDPNNGSMVCGNADDVTFVKRVQVLVSEEAIRGQQDSYSIMSGFPAGR